MVKCLSGKGTLCVVCCNRNIDEVMECMLYRVIHVIQIAQIVQIRLCNTNYIDYTFYIDCTCTDCIDYMSVARVPS
ncbi:hypothetical protein PMAC_003268 [Pneumocystis sp. 'macacae']|nr:hypothetical protein PMAC_003268 [Pneumocystis sp. 'macacae']